MDADIYLSLWVESATLNCRLYTPWNGAAVDIKNSRMRICERRGILLNRHQHSTLSTFLFLWTIACDLGCSWDSVGALDMLPMPIWWGFGGTRKCFDNLCNIKSCTDRKIAEISSYLLIDWLDAEARLFILFSKSIFHSTSVWRSGWSWAFDRFSLWTVLIEDVRLW